MTKCNSTGVSTPKQAKKQGRRALTTEQFIDKAKAVHGDTYNYKNVSYTNNSTKVDIECKLHGLFSQTPQHHLRGQGCPECARLAKIAKRKTLKQFIADAEAVHGKGRYDYSMAVYKSNKHKLKLKCNVCHTVFKQIAQNHLSGSQCPKCSHESRKTTQDEFIRKCIEVHGLDKYDYSSVNYVGSNKKVTIYCKACDAYFEQTAYIHIRGSNCPKCVNREKAKTTDEFIKKAVAVHGEKYSYDNVEYVNKREKVKIHCKNHGYFLQTPSAHLSGSGCMQCYIESQRHSQKEFIDKSLTIHGNTYSYEKVKYITSRDRVVITCKVHGDYLQMPSDHLNGNGCPECNTGRLGYGRSEFKRLCVKNNDGKGILYLIKCQDSKEVFYKIGITSRSVDDRFGKTYQMPYKYTILHEVINNPDFIFDLEVRLKAILDQYRYEPKRYFKGITECFSEIPKEVISLIKKLEKDRHMQLTA